MSKLTKRILIGTATTLLLITLSVLGYGYYWINNWKRVCTEEEMMFNASNLNNVKELPINFYRVWDKLYPESRDISMASQSFSEILNAFDIGRISECRCDDIGYTSWNNHNHDWKYDMQELLARGGYRRFGFGLENYSSPKKCFDYWINYDFQSMSMKGHYFEDLDELSTVLYSRPVSSISDVEVIELIAYRINGQYPIMDTARFEGMRDDLLKKWNSL